MGSSKILGLAVLILGVSHSADAGPRCDEFSKMCTSAGYSAGQNAPPKKKLWGDCVDAIAKGAPVEGVHLPAGFDINACKNEVAAENAREQKCTKVVGACKAAGFVLGGSKTQPNRALWFDCVHKVVENAKVPGVKLPPGVDLKSCGAAVAAVKKISYGK